MMQNSVSEEGKTRVRTQEILVENEESPSENTESILENEVIPAEYEGSMTEGDAGITAERATELENWKLSSTMIYDLLMCHNLEWPSLTIEFLSEASALNLIKSFDYEEEGIQEDDYTIETLLLGTHTSVNEQNSVLIYQVLLPKNVHSDVSKIFLPLEDYYGFPIGNKQVQKFKVCADIPHEGEVNCARFSPCLHDRKIATNAVDGSVFIFDAPELKILSNNSKLRKKNFKGKKVSPLLTLVGHQKEGFGLSWHPSRSEYITSSCYDGIVCVWDITANTENKSKISPLLSLSGHQNIAANDVFWSELNPSLLLSCGDDGIINLWDIRNGKKGVPSMKILGSKKPINSICSIPLANSTSCASGGDEKIISLWDFRYTSKSFHSFEAHKNKIISLKSSNVTRHMIISGSGTEIKYWDLSLIGVEQSPEDTEDGPPELLMTHTGHSCAVSDTSWCNNKHLDKMIASVSEDNSLHLWLPSKIVLNSKDDEYNAEEDSDRETVSSDVE